MPQIKFTDTAIAKLKTDKTTWFTDPSVKGLRLCVTGPGVKTWYAVKWDSQANKTRQIKLAQWADRGTHTRWAKGQVGKVILDIAEGKAKTRAERVIDKPNSLPTFQDALELMIERKSGARASGKRSMAESTIRDYRGSFKKHLGSWAHITVDELPVYEIASYLNELQAEKPEAAARAAAVAGSVIRFIGRVASRDLPVPQLVDPTKHKSRVETSRLDMSVPLADRWADIQQVENAHKRLALMLTVYTGIRGRPLRELTWDRVREVRLADGRTVTALLLDKPIKRRPEDREIVLADDAARIIGKLREIRADDCQWVFPSRRKMDGTRGCLDAIDKFGTTNAGDLRHYWMTIARGVAKLHVQKWLGLHTMKSAEFGMIGHYGVATPDEQYAGANAIASAINAQIKRGPANVVNLKQASA